MNTPVPCLVVAGVSHRNSIHKSKVSPEPTLPFEAQPGGPTVTGEISSLPKIFYPPLWGVCTNALKRRAFAQIRVFAPTPLLIEALVQTHLLLVGS
jgi:hypothetical protein